MKDTEQEDAEEQEEEKNPSIANPQWKNADGQSITKALVGDEVTLCADVQDIPDGTGAKIKIVEKDADGNDDDVKFLTAKVQDGKIKCKWKVIYTEDDDDSNSEQEKEEKGYTLPEYAFIVECGGATSEESPQLDVKHWVKVHGNIRGKKLLLIYEDGTERLIEDIRNDEIFIEYNKYGNVFIHAY